MSITLKVRVRNMILSISIQGTIGFVWNRINTRQFVQDRYIFRNGIIEDVPIGRIFGLGISIKILNGDHILEPKLLWKIPQMGVLSTNFEVAFFNSKRSRLPFLFKPTILQN
jgi:hypothetical protein